MFRPDGAGGSVQYFDIYIIMLQGVKLYFFEHIKDCDITCRLIFSFWLFGSLAIGKRLARSSHQIIFNRAALNLILWY
jgi:hypothetical protein